MATKKNTPSKAGTAKKSVAKTTPAKKVAKAAPAPVAKLAEKKAPAKAKVKASATKPTPTPTKKKASPKVEVATSEKKSAPKVVAKKPTKVPEKKDVAKKPAKKAEVKPAPKVESKSAKKAEVKPAKKVESKPAKKATTKVETKPVSAPATGTGMRTPTEKPTAVGKFMGALKPNYALIRPKSGGKKTGSVRHVTRSAFKDEDLEEFKRRLLEEREKKVKLQNAMSSDALSRPDEENVEEDGTNSSNRADMLQRAEETRKSLRAIDDALRAIENKTYGICSVCKCAISRERLRAAPFAIRCVKCKEEWERQVKASKRTMQ